MNHKGRLLAEWLENSDKYAIQNHGMETSLRSDTTIYLVLTTPTISLSHCGTLSYTSSDHLSILMELNGISLQDNNYTISKTYWEIYKNILTIINPCVQQKKKRHQDKPSKWFTFFQQLLEALKERVTLCHQTAQQRPALPSSLRLMFKHKHLLQNKYRHSKLEEDRIRLRSWKLNNVLPTQQSGSRLHLSTLTRVHHLMEQLTQSLRHYSFSVVVYIDFLQAFDMLWHSGLILKLQHLHCPYAYLCWIVNYFQDRTTTIDYQGHLSDQIVITRGAPQGSCFGPKAYIVNLFDLPQIFECTRKVHLYVDDLALLYSPSIYLKYIKQIDEIQTRINNDMVKLEQYADNNHQPVSKNKMEFVVFHKSVQVPKIRIVYQGQCIQQQKTFKYLDFHLDSKLSFRDHDDQIHYDVRNHDDRLFQSSNDDNFTSKA
ncbi:unnamed protein product [Rotaria socialis]|uniref:Reverse transcriptase domain-containing protein n=1 Tax=Rotaria socialis TaxID=392032 RepID=A0A820YN38_9BILA|nr:unnamed protein product [Rotaria socialis]